VFVPSIRCSTRLLTFSSLCPTLLVAAIAAPSNASAAAPTLSRFEPAGGQRGTTVSVKFTGKADGEFQIDAPGLNGNAPPTDNPVDALKSLANSVKNMAVSKGNQSGTLDITIPPTAATGRYWVRLWNNEGASDAVPFIVGQLPETTEVEPNNKPAEAQAIAALPMTVNGVLKGADVDGFAIPLEAGATLVASLDASTLLGSPIDSILQLVGPSGVVVAENHDAVGLDPRIVFTVPTTGIYIVRVFGFSSTPNTNIALQGGDDCLYRLSLTTTTYATHPLPLSMTDTPPASWAGWNLPESPVVELAATDQLGLPPRNDLRLPESSRWRELWSPGAAGLPRALVVPFPPLLVMSAAEPAQIAIPQAVTGLLKEPGADQRFRVTLTKGTPLLFTVLSKTIGLDIDPLVRIFDSEGKKIAEGDDTAGTRDVTLAYTAPADGDFLVSVTDRYGRGHDRGYFLLLARADEPDFELSLSADRYVVAPDKPAEVPVDIVRRNAAGKTIENITVEAVGLPAGVTAEAVVSEPKGDSAKKVTLKLSSTGPAFSGRVAIRGTASQPEGLVRTARTPLKLEESFDSIWLTVLPPPEPPKEKEEAPKEKEGAAEAKESSN
jgi:hypothetical protein